MEAVGVFPTELWGAFTLTVCHEVFPALVKVAVERAGDDKDRVLVQRVGRALQIFGRTQLIVIEVDLDAVKLICHRHVFGVPSL